MFDKIEWAVNHVCNYTTDGEIDYTEAGQWTNNVLKSMHKMGCGYPQVCFAFKISNRPTVAVSYTTSKVLYAKVMKEFNFVEAFISGGVHFLITKDGS